MLVEALHSWARITFTSAASSPSYVQACTRPPTPFDHDDQVVAAGHGSVSDAAAASRRWPQHMRQDEGHDCRFDGPRRVPLLGASAAVRPFALW